MILTIIEGYVSEDKKYQNAFVHSRIKSYIQNGIESKVFLFTSDSSKNDYTYEGVSVIVGGIVEMVKYINENNIDCLCFHFFSSKMAKALHMTINKYPVCIFVHGNEALMWYERIFPDKMNGLIPFLKFIKYICTNIYNIDKIRKFFKNNKDNIKIICVSEWMKNITIKNWKLDVSQISTTIIPNIINEEIFNYTIKDISQRYNILLIRHFSNGKYALDIAMNVINKLANYEEFKQMNILIIGKGRLYKKYISQVKMHPNVTFKEMFLTQSEISEIHKQNGIFLCPTRQDAQGVSMCEAMSSGLIPITSNNTAIPEFVPSEFNLALNTEDEMVKRIMEIIHSPELFLELSEKVSKYIHKKCSIKKTSMAEIYLMKEMVEKNG